MLVWPHWGSVLSADGSLGRIFNQIRSMMAIEKVSKISSAIIPYQSPLANCNILPSIQTLLKWEELKQKNYPKDGGDKTKRLSFKRILLEKIESILPKVEAFFPTYLKQKPESTITPLSRTIVVVGIHGWAVPHKLLQNILGVPSSSEFYTLQMASTIKKCYQDAEIIQVPLDGFGSIMERVELFLSNVQLREALSKATDVIFLAHSQGVPVGSLLLNRLIKENLFQDKKITLVALAGIFHGPFPYLGKNFFIQYMETTSSRELFELHSPSSTDPSNLAFIIRSTILDLLSFGIQIIAIGSWLDQLVPLYSSILYGYYHPNIIRLVYIEDKHLHAKQESQPSFLPMLISFCLSLKNVGFSDHGLLIYLSEWVAGSIYSGNNGHSSIYTDPSIYETVATILYHIDEKKDNLGSVKPKYVPFHVPETPNHYHIPWHLHALVSDPKLRSSEIIGKELDELVTAYSSWHPTTKLFKELKHKLAPLETFTRSNL